MFAIHEMEDDFDLILARMSNTPHVGEHRSDDLLYMPWNGRKMLVRGRIVPIQLLLEIAPSDGRTTAIVGVIGGNLVVIIVVVVFVVFVRTIEAPSYGVKIDSASLFILGDTSNERHDWLVVFVIAGIVGVVGAVVAVVFGEGVVFAIVVSVFVCDDRVHSRGGWTAAVVTTQSAGGRDVDGWID